MDEYRLYYDPTLVFSGGQVKCWYLARKSSQSIGRPFVSFFSYLLLLFFSATGVETGDGAVVSWESQRFQSSRQAESVSSQTRRVR